MSVVRLRSTSLFYRATYSCNLPKNLFTQTSCPPRLRTHTRHSVMFCIEFADKKRTHQDGGAEFVSASLASTGCLFFFEVLQRSKRIVFPKNGAPPITNTEVFTGSTVISGRSAYLIHCFSVVISFD